MRSLRDSLLNRLYDCGIAVPGNVRSVTGMEVDVLVAIYVP